MEWDDSNTRLNTDGTNLSQEIIESNQKLATSQKQNGSLEVTTFILHHVPGSNVSFIFEPDI